MVYCNPNFRKSIGRRIGFYGTTKRALVEVVLGRF